MESGFCGGKVRISHTDNLGAARALAEAIQKAVPSADIRIRENRALCAYYAERGGVLVGFEV